MGLSVLGIIPARGGSKGVPRKNVRPVAGEPLLAYAVRAARESMRLTAFLTSTDDDEIEATARRYGSPVLRRPLELAADATPMVAVLLHALAHAEAERGAAFDLVVLLQPSAPIRTGADIDAVIGLLADDPVLEGVISVTAMDDVHPARMYRLNGEGRLDPLWPEWETAQRQDLPLVYYRSGALYVVRRAVLREQHTMMPRRKKGYVMPLGALANIDDERDLAIADLLVQRWKERR